VNIPLNKLKKIYKQLQFEYGRVQALGSIVPQPLCDMSLILVVEDTMYYDYYKVPRDDDSTYFAQANIVKCGIEMWHRTTAGTPLANQIKPSSYK